MKTVLLGKTIFVGFVFIVCLIIYALFDFYLVVLFYKQMKVCRKSPEDECDHN